MGQVTADIAVSLDLVGAGRDQSFEHPFGPRVGHLHRVRAVGGAVPPGPLAHDPGLSA